MTNANVQKFVFKIYKLKIKSMWKTYRLMGNGSININKNRVEEKKVVHRPIYSSVHDIC